MISGKHEHHLQKLASVVGESATEPEQRHDAADSDLLFEDVGDGQTGVEEFLATVVGDGGDEGGGLADETQFLRPGVIDWDLGDLWLGGWLDEALLEHLLVDLLESLGEVLEGFWDEEAGITHALVLHGGRLELRVGEGAGVAELHFRLQHAGDGADGPGHDWLGDGAVLDSLDHAVFFYTTDLTQKQEDLAVGVGLVAEHVVDESRAGISVTANGHTLIHTVGSVGDDIVQLVRHAAGLGDVANGAVAVELGSHDVIHHATSVADLICTGLDATDCRRPNDCDALLLRYVEDLTCTSLWHALGDDGDGLDLRVLHELHGRLVDGSGRGEVDDGVNIAVFGHGLCGVLVDGEEGLRSAPVPALLSVDVRILNHFVFPYILETYWPPNV